MLHKTKSRSTGLWKYGFSAPLFILMLVVSAAAVKSEEVRIKPVAEALLSPLGSETSKDIISALELKNTTAQLENSTNLPVVTLSNETNTSSTGPDYTELRKHIQRNMKYPASARQNNITGLVVANFMIKDKKVTSITIEKSLQQDIDNEVIRTLSLYKDDIDVPDDKYSIAVGFQLVGPDTRTEMVPYVGGKNFTGQIIVTGYLAETNLKNKDVIPGTSPNNSLKLQEVVIGSDDDIVKEFTSVDVLPEFPGGLEVWSNYLRGNLKYPKLAKDNKVTGRVIVSFIVEKDGSLSEIRVLRGLGAGLDEEAVRVLKASPNWRPGIQDGKAVRVAYTMPIFFQLANNPPVPGNTEADKAAQRTLPADVKDFASVETLPEFSGGMAGWRKYLSENLKYPEIARKENITGRVIMSFIVEKDGSLSAIKVLRGIGGGADEEAVRILKASPNWKPGLLNGSAVRVAYTMPIFFQLGPK